MRIILIGIFMLSFYLINASSAFAFISLDWEKTGCLENGVATLRCIPIVFQNVVNWLLIFGAVSAIFFILFAGVKFIRSGGQPKLVEDARNTLTYAIIGFILILLSFAIINFISAATGVSCIKQFGFGNCNK